MIATVDSVLEVECGYRAPRTPLRTPHRSSESSSPPPASPLTSPPQRETPASVPLGEPLPKAAADQYEVHATNFEPVVAGETFARADAEQFVADATSTPFSFRRTATRTCSATQIGSGCLVRQMPTADVVGKRLSEDRTEPVLTAGCQLSNACTSQLQRVHSSPGRSSGNPIVETVRNKISRTLRASYIDPPSRFSLYRTRLEFR